MTNRGSVTRTELFKYITVAAILVFVILMLIFASGSTKAFDEVAKGVEASLDTEISVCFLVYAFCLQL